MRLVLAQLARCAWPAEEPFIVMRYMATLELERLMGLAPLTPPVRWLASRRRSSGGVRGSAAAMSMKTVAPPPEGGSSRACKRVAIQDWLNSISSSS